MNPILHSKVKDVLIIPCDPNKTDKEKDFFTNALLMQCQICNHEYQIKFDDVKKENMDALALAAKGEYKDKRYSDENLLKPFVCPKCIKQSKTTIICLN